MYRRGASHRSATRRGPPRGTPVVLGAVLSLALTGLFAILLDTSRRAPASPPSLTPLATAPTVITRPQTAAIGFIRATARRQLGQTSRQLDACGENPIVHLSRSALPEWRDCVRWPIAHLAVSA